MSSWQSWSGEEAGQDAWTRDFARDLFPGMATPFAWSVLRAPAEEALRRAWIELGASPAAASRLWRRAEDGQVFVSASTLAGGQAWLGSVWPEAPSGMLARLQTGGITRRVQACIDQARAGVTALQARMGSWLTWVHALRWSQADLLQVMEELEPRAREALQAYCILRAGLTAARAQVDDRLAEWLPDAPPGAKLSLYVGLEELPTVQAARQLIAAATASPEDPGRRAVLARYGHRGPGEMRPDARRWADDLTLLAHLPEHATQHTTDAAEQRRNEAEAWIAGRLEGGRRRQLLAALTRTRDLCLAVDLAWDALVMVIAAAQCWLAAASDEALGIGLISRPEDVLYLELEELKQVATGEWHRGHSSEVQAEVTRRRAQLLAKLAKHPRGTVDLAAPGSSGPAGPGQARGPAHVAISTLLPAPGAIWLAEAADPGCAPFWLGAGGLIAAATDAWSPGMTAARALGLPAVVGGAAFLANAQPGQMISIDGDTGRIALD